jgi:hypothetical protein
MLQPTLFMMNDVGQGSMVLMIHQNCDQGSPWPAAGERNPHG